MRESDLTVTKAGLVWRKTTLSSRT